RHPAGPPDAATVLLAASPATVLPRNPRGGALAEPRDRVPCDDGRTAVPPETSRSDADRRTAAEAVAELLAAAHVRRCYTVPGESFLELADAVDRRSDMLLVSTRHENGAGF